MSKVRRSEFQVDSQKPGGKGRAWCRFLLGRHAAYLTHGSLVLLTVLLFYLLLRLPFWLAFVPCVMIHHRIGMLLHEYVHDIPFARRRRNRLLLNVWDGLLLGFGSSEFFRVAHLRHHRWLNTPRDPGYRPPAAIAGGQRFSPGADVEGLQYVGYFIRNAGSRSIRAILPRLLAAAAQSAFWVAFWVYVGHADMPARLFLLTTFNALIPTSLRSAIEHNGPDSNRRAANEYKVLIPMFNINRHIHHHEDPRRPWYRLEYRTNCPLGTRDYFTYWWRAHVTREFHLLSVGAEAAPRGSSDRSCPSVARPEAGSERWR